MMRGGGPLGKSGLREIIIDSEVKDSAVTRSILERLGPHPTRFRTDKSRRDWDLTDSHILHLTTHPGRFFRLCPGSTREYVCCDLQTINLGTNCTLGCVYCFLSGYFAESYLTLFVNIDDLLMELASKVAQGGFYRFCTGEFTDSLLLDPYSRFSEKLIAWFDGVPNATLEIKTKTENIEHLLPLSHRGKTIISWSVNSDTIARNSELFAPSVSQRIHSARRACDAGYFTGFHFDPIVRHSNWRAEYRATLEQIAQRIKPEEIAWFSLGALRFPESLYQAIQTKYPGSPLLYDDFILGLDGKKRYARPIRKEIYSAMGEWIRELFPGVCVYFCMDSHDYWEDYLGVPQMNGDRLTRAMNLYTQRKIVEHQPGIDFFKIFVNEA